MKQTNLEQIPDTREKILTLLASSSCTIDGLARRTGVSKNAVRAQMATLEREGIVEIQGMFKSSRRPAALYGLSAGSDVYFSRAYPIVLSQLILTLANKLPHNDFLEIMKELGQRIAATTARPSGSPHDRVQAGLKFLRAIGSIGQMGEEDGNIVITSLVCPISRAVAADARVCSAMETLLRELTGLPIEQHCKHGERQSCRFTVNLSGKMDEVG